MADENNKDLAILGFRIESQDAERAINSIISALGGISTKANEVDQALEDKVTKALNALSGAAAKLGNDKFITGLSSTVEALKSLSESSSAFQGFIDTASDVKKGVALLNKVNLGSILEGYSSAIKNTGNEFSKLNPILKDAVKGFSDALSIPDTDKRAQAMGKVSESLRGLYQTLNEYTGEKPAKILPKGILEGDVKDTALKVDTLRGYLDEYVSVLTRVNEVSGKSRHDMQQYNPDEWAKQNQADLAKAKDNAIAVMTDIAKTWQNLNPSFSTIRFNIEIANMDVIKRQLHSGIEVKLAVPPAEVDRFNNVATTMEKLAKPVAVTYDTKQANDIKQLLSDITPKFTITESAINSLQRQMDDASQRLAMEVKIVPRVTGDDEAIAQMQKQAAERARDALTAMGIDVHGKKSIEDAIKGDYYGLVNIGKDLEQLYGGDKVNGILGDLFPKQGATSEQMFKSFTESLGEVRRNMEGLLAFKATLDTSEFDAALDKFKDTLTSVFTPESKQKFTNALVEDLKKTVLKPASITVSPQKIFVDRSDAIMEFVQKTLAMPINDMMVSPTTIWVDRSNAEIRLLQVQLVADWQDVIVHPKNIVIDAAYIQNLGPIKYSQSALPVSAKIKILPTAATIDSNAAKEIVGTSKTTIKVSSPIKIDPLPSDEITKMNDLVTQIANVNQAYSGLIGTVRTLKSEIDDLERSMSKELRSLIKGEQHKVDAKIKDPEKAAAVQAKELAKAEEKRQKELDKILEKLAKEEEAAEALKSAYETMKRPYDEAAQARKTSVAASVSSLQNKVFDDVINGKIGEKQREDILAVEEKTKEFSRQAENASKTFVNAAQNNVRAARAEANAMRQRIEAIANANVAFRMYGVTARDVTLKIQEFGRVQRINMIDPLEKMKATLGDTNNRLVDIGRTFGLYFSGRTIVNYFRQASESANTFQLEIRRIQSLALDFDFGKLRDGLMDIDARFGNVTHNAAATYWAYSSGVRGTEKELVQFTETMSKLATTIKADVMPTVDSVTSVMNAFNVSAGQAGELADLIFSIIKYGKSNASQLTTSLGHVVAPAAALNLQLDELGASIAVLTKTMRTNRALTYLSNILGKMASPTKAVQEAAAELGIELSANAIKARGFAQTLKDIRLATGGDVGKLAKLFPDLRGQRAALTLISTQYKDFEAQLDNMRQKSGRMEEALSKIADTPEAQIKALKNTMGMLAIETGRTVNEMLTLGGALGPVLEWFNGLEHSGRAIAGNLIAAGASMGGLFVAQKAFAAAQYAMLQTSVQMAMSATELRRNELDIALTKERQSMENSKIALSELKAKIAADQYNDATLRNLQAKRDELKLTIRQGAVDLNNAKMALKVSDDLAKRNLLASAGTIGQTIGRVNELKNLRMLEQTGKTAQNYKNDLNLVARLKADIQQMNATLKQSEQDFLTKQSEKIRGYVENSLEVQKDLQDAMEKGNLSQYEKANAIYSKIVQTIKSDTVISGELARYDNAETMLEIEAKRYVMGKLQANLVSGVNDQHRRRLEYLDAEIKKYERSLASQRESLTAMKEQFGLDKEQQAAVDKIAQTEANLMALRTEEADILNKIDARSNNLVGRQKEQAAVLAENIKLMKSWLDADTTDSENLKANLELSLKNAATIGRNTLAATQEAYNAEMKRQSIIMEQRSVMSDILSITDKDGKLLDQSEQSQKRLNALLEQQRKLMEESEASRKRFVELGLKAGNQEAQNIAMSNLRGYLGKKLNGRKYSAKERELLLGQTARDSKVVSESIRAMAKGIGGSTFQWFGGNSMRLASMGMSFMPGMSKYAMPMTLMSSFNVLGKMAGGFSRLTGTMLKLTSTTERLQKNGLLSMRANVESLTKTLMTSSMWTKKQALANQGLMAMRHAGVSKDAMANFGVLSTWLTAGVGAVLGVVLFSVIKNALDKTEKGGPLGGIAENLYGIGDKERYGSLLEQRSMMIRDESENANTMQLTLSSLVKASAEEVKVSKERLENAKKLHVSTEELADSEMEVLDAEVLMAKQRDALAKIVSTRNVISLEGQIDNAQQRIREYQDRIKSWANKLGADIGTDYLNNLIAIEQQHINGLQEQLKSQLNKRMQGIAALNFLALKESLTADREAAFTPLKDEQGKYESAMRMTGMAKNRIASLLSTDGRLFDIANMTTDEVDKMIESRVNALTIAYETAKKAESDATKAKDAIPEGDDKEKAEKELQKLSKATQDAKKRLDDFQQNFRAASNDYYNNIIAASEALVKKTLFDVKQSAKDTKYADQFRDYSMSFQMQEKSIVDIQNALTMLQEDYARSAKFFNGPLGKNKLMMFKARKKELMDALKEQVSGRITELKSLSNNLASFMDGLSSDMQSLEKQLFDFRINNPAYAGMQNKLINKRFGMLGQMLYGQNGVMELRNKALEDAKRLQGLGDMTGTMQKLAEAQKFQKQAVGYEQQQLELVKLKANKEREINSSLYQLANTLRGQFAATSQAAIEVSSLEGIRLTSRRLGENIAPPTAFTYQNAEAKMFEKYAAENKKAMEQMMQFGESYFRELGKRLDDASINGASAKLGEAATNINSAAHTFERAAAAISNIRVVKI